MESLWLLIPLSVLLAFIIGALFWWAVGAGQFDDLNGPGERILQDDDRTPDTIGAAKQNAKNQSHLPGI